MKTLYLMRHGQTQYNVEGRIQGWCDSPLTETGRDQASRVNSYLQAEGLEDWAYLASSDLKRAQDTLALAQSPREDFHLLSGLREACFGQYEKQSRDHLPREDFNRKIKAAGGETIPEVQERLVRTCTYIMEQIEEGEKAFAVAHGRCIRLFADYWQAKQGQEAVGEIANCSLLVFNYDGQAFQLKEIIVP
ncbi:histidine phosphatase family protein [Aerococcus sp. UMB7834]|uniref:histidine phosphatase family protein n=1 Tax=Aerococcus sp. UMB7834 TaxID=3046342 RepID=UPI00254AA94B|nr:histidine phosphatase family protein [Aerococcus sp. UMB7834]MDK6804529.1 histidine phosphatase family protein [Aerococcus sp. UMB7834]